MYVFSVPSHTQAMVDFRVPVSQGGRDSVYNMRIICASCFKAKYPQGRAVGPVMADQDARRLSNLDDPPRARHQSSMGARSTAQTSLLGNPEGVAQTGWGILAIGTLIIAFACLCIQESW